MIEFLDAALPDPVITDNYKIVIPVIIILVIVLIVCTTLIAIKNKNK